MAVSGTTESLEPMKTIRTRTKARARRSRWGATTVEFALCAPVLFLFIFGIVEASRAVMVKHALSNAAREGSREASLITTTSGTDVETVVRNSLRTTIAGAANSQIVKVTTTPATLSGLTTGSSVSVQVDVNYSDITWLPGSVMNMAGGTVLSAVATQERE
jgi:Flp pilus assembly protein TadG